MNTYNEIASNEVLNKTVKALALRNVEAIIVNDKTEALAKIKELIPKGSSVNNGSSKTLEQIGFIDYLKNDNHGWDNLHAKILAEKDPVKQAEIRKQSVFTDYYLGSVHALSEKGEIVIASASGSQLPPIVFTSPNLIFVVGSQKIVPTLEEALTRLREYVFPLENDRMKSVGMGGSVLSKILILEKEPEFMKRKVMVILVKENLGF